MEKQLVAEAEFAFPFKHNGRKWGEEKELKLCVL